nr:hypothetical protein [Tanacetum cinerariifolium]
MHGSFPFWVVIGCWSYGGVDCGSGDSIGLPSTISGWLLAVVVNARLGDLTLCTCCGSSSIAVVAYYWAVSGISIFLPVHCGRLRSMVFASRKWICLYDLLSAS